MPDEATPAGYAALQKRWDLDVMPNWHTSRVATNNTHRVDATGVVIEETYPAKYWPGETLGDHLEFALKYDGTNLSTLARLFAAVDPEELLAYIRSKPTGKYARRVWYLYEMMTGERLDLEDLKQGNYVDLLDPREYYTIESPVQRRRHRINDNLPGDRRFCPLVRRTERLRTFEEQDLVRRCREVVSPYPADLLRRALSFLYTKETKSSFEIENIQPDSTRTERFISLLHAAEHEDYCRPELLVELQNRIVDARFRDDRFRTTQNYVGETVLWQRETVHFAGPQPGDLPELMEGLMAAHQRMAAGNLPAVVHAAAIAYGFVYLHPFEDGNGRIHRFLIHNILARREFTPEGIMFPVSAAMLKNSALYNASLESFSRPLMAMVDYSLDEEGRMTVRNETATWYRYIDMTDQTEALFEFIEQTIDSELVAELDFLASYDETKGAIQQIADMPDRKIDLFIRFCLQNDCQISARKRSRHFAQLSDDEIAAMQQAVQSSYAKRPK